MTIILIISKDCWKDQRRQQIQNTYKCLAFSKNLTNAVSFVLSLWAGPCVSLCNRFSGQILEDWGLGILSSSKFSLLPSTGSLNMKWALVFSRFFFFNLFDDKILVFIRTMLYVQFPNNALKLTFSISIITRFVITSNPFVWLSLADTF